MRYLGRDIRAPAARVSILGHSQRDLLGRSVFACVAALPRCRRLLVSLNAHMHAARQIWRVRRPRTAGIFTRALQVGTTLLPLLLPATPS